MIETQLIPDIRRKLLGYDCVYVQMDGAKAHVKAWDKIEELGATRVQMDGQKTPIIRFVKQPANSPDTNVLDLCFFRSLGKLVSKDERKYKQGYLGKQAFWKHVEDFPRLSQKKRPWIGAGGWRGPHQIDP